MKYFFVIIFIIAFCGFVVYLDKRQVKAEKEKTIKEEEASEQTDSIL